MKICFKFDGNEYDVRIKDYTCGIKGFWSVKAYSKPKKLFDKPVVNFNTFGNPFEVLERKISKAMVKEESYERTLEEMKGYKKGSATDQSTQNHK